MTILQQQNAELRAQKEHLATETLRLGEEAKRLGEERERYRELYVDLMERFRKLEQGIMGQKRERLPGDERQLSLQLLEQILSEREEKSEEEDEEPEDETEQEVVVERHTRKAKGRKPLPANLPRIEMEVLPPEVEHEGLDAFERIGEESSEIIERRPSLIVVVRTVRWIRPDVSRSSASLSTVSL